MIVSNFRNKMSGKNVRVMADVTVGTSKKTIWYEVKREYSKFLQNDGSAYLASVLVPAMILEENIFIEGSVSRKMLIATKKIIHTLHKWKVGKRIITVTTSETYKKKTRSKSIASFFSAGVDSFYTLIKHRDIINHLIHIQGLDTGVDEYQLNSKILRRMRQIASHYKKRLIVVKTNVREFTDAIVPLGWSLGGILASVAHILGSGLTTAYIPGRDSIKRERFYRHGSHPDLDLLWSSEHTKIIHDSDSYTRLAKIKLLTHHSSFLKHLKVCWLNKGGAYNCSECDKCIRTMIELKSIGKLEKVRTFRKNIDLNQVKHLILYGPAARLHLSEVLIELEDHAIFPELQMNLRICLRNAKYPPLKMKLIKIIRHLDQKYNHQQLFNFLLRTARHKHVVNG